MCDVKGKGVVLAREDLVSRCDELDEVTQTLEKALGQVLCIAETAPTAEEAEEAKKEPSCELQGCLDGLAYRLSTSIKQLAGLIRRLEL